jgi:Protein of unknown function (DUF3455)
MTRLTRLCRAVGVGLTVATATLAMTQEADAALPPPKIHPDQAAIQVPPANVAYLVGHATGTQNYKCTANADNTFTWKFVEPVATLLTDSKQVIKHSAGPTWTFEADGSAVSKSGDVKSAAGPDPANDIPWLLVPVGPAGTSNDPGDLLTGTTFIQRVNTDGGVAPPADQCNAATAGTTKPVDYTADYYFYKAAGKSNPPGLSNPPGKPGA